jgi:large subunit ribosomal protein L10
MALSLQQKEAQVAEVREVAQSAQSAVAAEYRGLTVGQMTELRAQARSAGVFLKVVKNTLAKIAVEGTEFACLQDSLKGPVLLAFSNDDPGSAARVVKAFAKDNDKLVTISVAIGGQVLPANQLEALASLPTLDEARSQLVRVLQAPMSQLVRTLAEPAAMLARTLQAKADSAAAS